MLPKKTQRVFSLTLFSCKFGNQYEPIFSQICYFMHNVGIHQVRILVFENYQTGPVPLTVECHEYKRLSRENQFISILYLSKIPKHIRIGVVTFEPEK